MVVLSSSKNSTTIRYKYVFSLVVLQVQVHFLNKKICELYIFNLIDWEPNTNPVPPRAPQIPCPEVQGQVEPSLQDQTKNNT